jgi:hypothetical protein
VFVCMPVYVFVCLCAWMRVRVFCVDEYMCVCARTPVCLPCLVSSPLILPLTTFCPPLKAVFVLPLANFKTASSLVGLYNSFYLNAVHFSTSFSGWWLDSYPVALRHMFSWAVVFFDCVPERAYRNHSCVANTIPKCSRYGGQLCGNGSPLYQVTSFLW